MIEELTSMTPWQRRMLDRVMDPDFSGFSLRAGEIGGRRAGRVLATRIAIEWAAARGTHIHWACRGGLWCVTRQPIGLLYARLPKPHDHADRYAVDEDTALVTRRSR